MTTLDTITSTDASGLVVLDRDIVAALLESSADAGVQGQQAREVDEDEDG